MILRLLLSAALSWLVWLAIDAMGAAWSRDLRLLAFLVAVIVLGYHRNLSTPGGTPHWWRITIPNMERVVARNSLWGLPLGRGRTIRVSVAVRGLAERFPGALWAAELFPALLVRPVRRMLTRFRRKR